MKALMISVLSIVLLYSWARATPKPEIPPGTRFERVGNSRVYREIPKDRLLIQDYDAKR